MRSVLVGSLVFVLSLARSLSEGFGLTDESWFLQVVSRVRGTAVLYRDVSYGATPLAVYLTRPLVHLLGTEILAVKIVTNAAFAVTVVIIDRLARRVGIPATQSWLVVCIAILLARPYGNPPYTPVAMMLFAGAMALALVAVSRAAAASSRTSPLPIDALAGACAGLSFMAKQNVGALAAGAVLMTALLTDPVRARIRIRCSLIASAFGAAVLILAAPVVISGGLPGLWDYGFAGKSAYLRLGRVNYVASLQHWLDEAQVSSVAGSATALVHGFVLVLPLVVAVVAATRAFGRTPAERCLVVFAAAATATAYPRWDRFHMGYAVPVHLLTLMTLARPLKEATSGVGPVRGLTRWLMPVAIAGLLAAAVASPVAAFADQKHRPSRLPHFRWVLLPGEAEPRLAAEARRLTEASQGMPTFILSTEAGFWYLESDLQNPTSFDIPAMSSVGRYGVSSILHDVSTGRVQLVCLVNRPATGEELVEVESFVRTYWQRGPDAGPCSLFRQSDRRLPQASHAP
jgi:hypothetical protein